MASQPPPNQIYDTVASDYDVIWSVPAVKILLPLLTNTLNDLGSWKDKVVLDMACGTGIGLRVLQQLGASKLVGVDISNEMLQVARSTPGSEKFELHHADCSKDMNHLGLEAGSFDLVIGMWLLNYPQSSEEMQGMWSNIASFLRPGTGRFVGIIQNHSIVHPSSMQGKMDLYGAQESDVRELENGEGWRMHVEFGSTPEVEFDTFVLKKEILQEEARRAGLRGLRYLRAGEEVKGCVEGKREEWWRELLEEYPNQVLVAEKA